jgi:4-hydroxy-2-oxoheptanedioate aldolase
MGSYAVTKIAQNPVRHKLHNGQPAVGTWHTLCSPVACELIAALGWDWVVVDAQHSPVGFDTMVNCFRAIQLGGSIPMARVPWNDTIWMQRTLDAGALGLVIPMVNTVADAVHAVANCQYATRGIRSFTSGRTAPYMDAEGEYTDWANANVAVIPMIETVEAVRNAEAILSVEGVDGCFIGPRDLGLSMGITPREMGPGTEHEALMLSVLAAGKKVGTAVGKHCADAKEVNERIAQGFQFLALASDQAFMMAEAKVQFAQVKTQATRL